jgi:hypothetical protein
MWKAQLNTQPMAPPVNASTPYDAKTMTQGLSGVLTLPSRGITSGAASAPIF